MVRRCAAPLPYLGGDQKSNASSRQRHGPTMPDRARVRCFACLGWLIPISACTGLLIGFVGLILAVVIVGSSSERERASLRIGVLSCVCVGGALVLLAIIVERAYNRRKKDLTDSELERAEACCYLCDECRCPNVRVGCCDCRNSKSCGWLGRGLLPSIFIWHRICCCLSVPVGVP